MTSETSASLFLQRNGKHNHMMPTTGPPLDKIARRPELILRDELGVDCPVRVCCKPNLVPQLLERGRVVVEAVLAAGGQFLAGRWCRAADLAAKDEGSRTRVCKKRDHSSPNPDLILPAEQVEEARRVDDVDGAVEFLQTQIIG